MKLSAGTIGTVLFTAAGIAVFVLMAKRTPDEGVIKSAMNFGMPMQPAVVKEKMPEATMPEAAPTTTTETPMTSMPEATAPEMTATPEVEAVKTDETMEMPATSEISTPATTESETKTEEIPATMPTDAPVIDGSTTTN